MYVLFSFVYCVLAETTDRRPCKHTPDERAAHASTKTNREESLVVSINPCTIDSKIIMNASAVSATDWGGWYVVNFKLASCVIHRALCFRYFPANQRPY